MEKTSRLNDNMFLKMYNVYGLLLFGNVFCGKTK